MVLTENHWTGKEGLLNRARRNKRRYRQMRKYKPQPDTRKEKNRRQLKKHRQSQRAGDQKDNPKQKRTQEKQKKNANWKGSELEKKEGEEKDLT